MARARNIKPGFFKNEELGQVPFETRLLFAGLWCLADREGRIEDRPKRIKAEIFPYDDELDLDSMLNQLCGEFIARYEHDSRKYIAILNWSKHQKPHHKEVPSAIPPYEGSKNKYNHRPVTKTQRARILERDGYECAFCKSSADLQIDHIVMVSDGGTSDDENLRTLCSSCNNGRSKKRAQLNDEASILQEQGNQSALCPTDSLNLIPDSGYLIPSTATPGGIPAPESFDYEKHFSEVWEMYPDQGRTKIMDSQRFYIDALRPDPWRMHNALMESIVPGGKWAVSEAWAKGFISQLSEFIRNQRWLENPKPYDRQKSPTSNQNGSGGTPGSSKLSDGIDAHRARMQAILSGGGGQ